MRLAPFVVLLLPTLVQAQFLNRAVWLGRGNEFVRRDYEQGVEYFLDRFSYVDLPPWWRPLTLDPFGDRLMLTGGSVSTSDLTIEAIGNFGVELGDGFTARLNYLQSENQTTQFQRVGAGIDMPIAEPTSLFVQLEGTPNKSRADISFGAELFRDRYQAHRVMVTLVDFASRKSSDFSYDEDPYALMAAGFFGDPDSFELAYEIGAQLPFEERELATNDVFRMHRTIGSLMARLRLSKLDRLVLGYDGEWTIKKLSTADPSSPTAEDYDVSLHRLRAEWWRSRESGIETSFGGYWLYLAEDGDRPADPASDLYTRRKELMAFARTRFPLSDAWSTEPYVIGGLVDLLQVDGTGDLGDEAFDGFQGKWGVPVQYHFSERAALRIDLSLQLDELGFGGGGVQFLAVF
jgi:hypothetical protein